MHHSARLPILCCLAVVACNGDGGLTPTESGPIAATGDIVYAAYEGGGAFDIYVVNEGGGEPRPLTSVDGAFSGKWSHDGRWIVYAVLTSGRAGSTETAHSELFVMRADGTDSRQITHEANGVDHPEMSPDGRRVVYSCFSPTLMFYQLCVINLDGTGRQELTSEELHAESPSWSPDGSRIAFHCVTRPVHDYGAVCTIRPDGSGRTEVPNTSGMATPAWSPDGKTLAVSCVGLCVIAPDGSQLRSIAFGNTTTGRRHTPAWSPDGRRLAFVHDSLQGSRISVVDVDGTNERRLTAGALGLITPSWSPR